MNPELRHTRDLAYRLNGRIDAYEVLFHDTAPEDAGAVERACDRLREGLIVALRQACDELGMPLPPDMSMLFELVQERKERAGTAAATGSLDSYGG